MNVKWNDNHNPPYNGTLDLSSVSGTGDNLGWVSDGVNENIDRQCELEVKPENPGSAQILTVKQKGKREIIMTQDSQVVGLKGLGTVNVLKQ